MGMTIDKQKEADKELLKLRRLLLAHERLVVEIGRPRPDPQKVLDDFIDYTLTHQDKLIPSMWGESEDPLLKNKPVNQKQDRSCCVIS